MGEGDHPSHAPQRDYLLKIRPSSMADFHYVRCAHIYLYPSPRITTVVVFEKLGATVEHRCVLVCNGVYVGEKRTGGFRSRSSEERESPPKPIQGVSRIVVYEALKRARRFSDFPLRLR